MAHGSKKWIEDWKGRVKRSRKRTQQDWLGKLAAPNVTHWQREKHCPQCKALAKIKHISHWHIRLETEPPAPGPVDHKAWLRWCRRTRRKSRPVFADGRYWLWIAVSCDDLRLHPKAKCRAVYTFVEARCRSCREKDHVLSWGRHNGDRAGRWSGRNVPADYRREIERQRRAVHRDLMRRAKHNPELYDEVMLRYNRDAAYRYW